MSAETSSKTAIHVMHAINARRRNPSHGLAVAGFSATVPMFFVAGVRALERETLAKLDQLESELCP